MGEIELNSTKLNMRQMQNVQQYDNIFIQHHITRKPKSSSSLVYGPYTWTSTFFRMTAHTDPSSDFFLHLLTPTEFNSFSI